MTKIIDVFCWANINKVIRNKHKSFPQFFFINSHFSCFFLVSSLVLYLAQYWDPHRARILLHSFGGCSTLCTSLNWAYILIISCSAYTAPEKKLTTDISSLMFFHCSNLRALSCEMLHLFNGRRGKKSHFIFPALVQDKIRAGK